MNKKLKFNHCILLIMTVFIIIGMLYSVTLFAASNDVKILHTIDFNQSEQSTSESWFTPSSASQIAWQKGDNMGLNDDYVLKGTHTGTDYTGANNAIHLKFPETLPAGFIYNVEVSFYVPSALNQGKSTITGPGVVLNGMYSNNSYKLPSSPGTIEMDSWKTLKLNIPVMTEDFSSIDFRFVVNNAANHPDVWYIDHIVISQVGDQQPIPKWDLTIPSLADTYKDKFLFGNILDSNQLDAKTTAMYKLYYNVLTPENSMKPSSISTTKGVYNYSNIDSVINWAEQNDIKVHGHTLVWHSQSPNWLNKNADGTPLKRDEARQNLQDYVNEVAKHFAGKVISWDVVNEAFDEGSLPFSSWKDVVRKSSSPWYLAYANGADSTKGESGADYIYDAFVCARQADPKAILYYNDYNETDDWKREAIGQMAEDLNAKWLNDSRNTEPDRKLIEGVGMQSHFFSDNLDPSQVEASIQRFIKAGLKISVSELDICYGSYNGTTNLTLTKEQQIIQSILYARLFEIYNKYSEDIPRVTIWGKADSQSWRSTQSPVLFDTMYTPKEAFYAVLNPKNYLTQQGLPSNVSTSTSTEPTVNIPENSSSPTNTPEATKTIEATNNPKIPKFELILDKMKIQKNKTTKLTLKIKQLKGSKNVNIDKPNIHYFSSNSTVATVNSKGIITAKKSGKTNLTAEVILNGKKCKSNDISLTVTESKI